MVSSLAIRDPYLVLNLPHSATQDEIKKSYRNLARQYHPDRVTDPDEKDKATASFAEISTAYALLSEPRRKAQYDHIYKYGGFDDDNVETDKIKFTSNHSSKWNNTPGSPSNTTFQQHQYDNDSNQASRKRKSATGIGYVCTDPLAFIWSQGKVQLRQTVAGIQIPSRLQHGNSGIKFAFSAGYVTRSSTGLRQHSCSTTQFVQGQKFTRSETTTYYPDGRKEVVIEGDDCGEQRYFTTYPEHATSRKNGTKDDGVTHAHDENSPWYVSAWSEIKDKLTMCYNPCTVDTRQ